MRNEIMVKFLLVDLKAMNFEAFFGGEPVVAEELRDVVPLVTLKLNDFTVFGMLDDCPVAGKLLLQRLHDPLLVELLTNSLRGKKVNSIQARRPIRVTTKIHFIMIKMTVGRLLNIKIHLIMTSHFHE